MRDCEQLKRQKLDAIVKYVLTPLESIKELERVNQRLCFDTAQTLNGTIDWLILLGRIDLAQTYATMGEQLIRLSIDEDEWPAGMDRRAYPSCLVKWLKYEHLHGLSWMVDEKEHEEYLELAINNAREFMDDLRAQSRPRLLSEYTMAFVELAGKLGLFKEATAAAVLVKESGAKRSKRAKPISPRIVEYFQEIFSAAIATESVLSKGQDLIAFLETIGIGEYGDYEASEIGDIEIFWLSYIACKFIPQYAPIVFTRATVQQPMQHLLPEMLGA